LVGIVCRIGCGGSAQTGRRAEAVVWWWGWGAWGGWWLSYRVGAGWSGGWQDARGCELSWVHPLLLGELATCRLQRSSPFTQRSALNGTRKLFSKFPSNRFQFPQVLFFKGRLTSVPQLAHTKGLSAPPSQHNLHHKAFKECIPLIVSAHVRASPPRWVYECRIKC